MYPMRSLIKYELDEPPTSPTTSLGAPAPPHGHTRRPPTKKRKRNQHNQKRSQFGPSREMPLQHWDDPGSAAVGVAYDEQEGSATNPASFATGSVTVSYADDVEEGEEDYREVHAAEGDEAVDVEEEEEESRALTHEEIWDDAALIDAWNSAEAEYEAYHGASKPWKTEPVKKSPLWYNKPYTAPTPQPGPKLPSKNTSQGPGSGEPEPDSAPFDFHTFVPTHDASLAGPPDAGGNLAPTAPFFVPPPSTTTVSRDEAFNNALSAMYWSGYWTAVFHCQSQSSGQSTSNVTAGASEENGIEADGDGDEDEEDLVPAQR